MAITDKNYFNPIVHDFDEFIIYTALDRAIKQQSFT